MMPLADLRNSHQLGPPPLGAGGMPARRRMVRIVVAPTQWPSPWSSPLILTTPQRGLSLAMPTIRQTSAGSRDGRPVLSWRNVHLRLTSSRCQRKMVAGLTTNPDQSSRGMGLASAAIIIRSRRRSPVLLFDRFRTAS